MTTRLAALFAALAACSSSNHNGPTCGDGVVEGSEQCDDGNTASGDGCSASCTTEAQGTCGNGQVEGTEQCDDGNTTAGDGCSATCTIEQAQPVCGNGHVEGSEQCDDGNTTAGDGCSSTCTTETPVTGGDCNAPTPIALADDGTGTLVGSGSGDTTGGTSHVAEAECDGFTSGGGNDQIWSFTLADTRDVVITIDGATTAFDAAVRVLSTPCDLATEVAAHVNVDGCADSNAAGVDEVLGYVKLPAGTYYVVIDGYDDTQLGAYAFHMSASATTCGNGTLEVAETCDDGNTATGDGCDDRCGVETGYVCDTTVAPSVCTVSCGNGTLDLGEECEDGNTAPGDRCSATCTLESDVTDTESNDTTPQTITAANHVIRGTFSAGDVDLYTVTLTTAGTLQLETYDTMDPMYDYDGTGALSTVDCYNIDTVLHVFDAAGNPADDTTAVASDDDSGAGSCSYITQALAAGTYTVKVNLYGAADTTDRYLLDVHLAP